MFFCPSFVRLFGILYLFYLQFKQFYFIAIRIFLKQDIFKQFIILNFFIIMIYFLFLINIFLKKFIIKHPFNIIFFNLSSTFLNFFKFSFKTLFTFSEHSSNVFFSKKIKKYFLLNLNILIFQKIHYFKLIFYYKILFLNSLFLQLHNSFI